MRKPEIKRSHYLLLVLLLITTAFSGSATGCDQIPSLLNLIGDGNSISVNDLPKEAIDTIKLIQNGGPYPYKQDNTVFSNREGLLPQKSSGYYHEYTVKTPGSPDRGARRIVTGKDGELYYTDDHYASFRVITGISDLVPESGQNQQSTGSQVDASGISINDLPEEAVDTIELIQNGEPFPYSQDGDVYQNREKLLPAQQDGYYHVYTVETPGASDRGDRRIVTGKGGQYYYTDDHYGSFRVITGITGAAAESNQNQQPAGSNPGINEISVNALPREARDTLQLIKKGGPFPYKQDNTVFSNREGLLPRQPSGYYHEYTVITPGASNRGTRRIVAGKVGEYYYTGDHYASFKRIVE